MIFSAALAGALLGFLRYNFNPAKVFMGDTGSLFLGGAVAGLAFACEMPLILLLVGLIYIIETLSVILQVTYFKATHGKRLFKMAPIHHHFEMCGWGEKKIVLVFTGITVVLCLLAYHVALAPLFLIRNSEVTLWLRQLERRIRSTGRHRAVPCRGMRRAANRRVFAGAGAAGALPYRHRKAEAQTHAQHEGAHLGYRCVSSRCCCC